MKKFVLKVLKKILTQPLIIIKLSIPYKVRKNKDGLGLISMYDENQN